MRFAGYATAHSRRLPAAECFAKVAPWCWITLMGMDGDKDKQMVLEPTAPLPGAGAETHQDDLLRKLYTTGDAQPNDCSRVFPL